MKNRLAAFFMQKGESQGRSDGRYVYTYTDPLGRRKYVYAQDLVTLREKEAQLMKDQMDGLDIYVAGKATVNRYMSLKNNLKPTTKSNYLYMYDRFIRDTLGKRNIAEIKYSDVVQFYNHLTKKQELRWLMTTFQQVQSSIKMNGNANRD